jgi:hypothetical protein
MSYRSLAVYKRHDRKSQIQGRWCRQGEKQNGTEIGREGQMLRFLGHLGVET